MFKIRIMFGQSESYPQKIIEVSLTCTIDNVVVFRIEL